MKSKIAAGILVALFASSGVFAETGCDGVSDLSKKIECFGNLENQLKGQIDDLSARLNNAEFNEDGFNKFGINADGEDMEFNDKKGELESLKTTYAQITNQRKDADAQKQKADEESAARQKFFDDLRTQCGLEIADYSDCFAKLVELYNKGDENAKKLFDGNSVTSKNGLKKVFANQNLNVVGMKKSTAEGKSAPAKITWLPALISLGVIADNENKNQHMANLVSWLYGNKKAEIIALGSKQKS